MEPGWYIVTEIQVPEGYLLDTTPHYIEVEPLQGAKFRVSEKEGRLIGEFESDVQGEIMINGLQPGWYTIEEIPAPAGYVIDETPKDVEFVWGQFINVEFLNSRKAPLQIKKTDGKTGAL